MTDTITTDRLDLVLITAPIAETLIAGDRSILERGASCAAPNDWPDAHDRRFLEMRLGQMREDPAAEQWLARAIVLREGPSRPMIGHAGFHGQPAEDGSVEMGYTVFTPWRGHGYATEAVRGLMCWAGETHGIRRFVLSISPNNAPSLGIARKLGFSRIGQHIDEEDGLEYVFRLDVDAT